MNLPESEALPEFEAWPSPGSRGPSVGRRSFLGMAAASGLGLAVGVRPTAAGALEPPFRHGVASGDPLADAVVIWTRLTPTPESTPGSGLGPATQVGWEVASDPSFTDVVVSGVTSTGPERDHTVHVDVSGLRPGTRYWYRFVVDGSTSPVGRTRTAPAPGSPVDVVRIGLVTCAEWEFGAFGAYGRLAERDDVDVVLHLGDYIYEFGLGYGPAASPGPRTHEPEHEIVTLEDYRIRYAQYHGDEGSLGLHAAHPVVCMYDDHEIANDTWKGGAENHDESEGDFADRARSARQAWREWLPVRVQAPDPEVVHRRFRFGDLVDLWMVDERRYRDAPPTSGPFSLGSVDPAIVDPARSMLGLEQRAWLLDGMRTSEAAWKVLGNPVPFIPQNVGPEVPATTKAALGAFTEHLPVNRPAYYVDDWNGYVGERDVVFEAWSEMDDVVVLTGDYHESFASDLPRDPGSYAADGESVAVEFVAPSVTSPGYSETLSLSGAPPELTALADSLFGANFTTSNPWIKYHEGFSNGYGVVEFSTARVQFDFHFLDDRADAGSGAPVAASWKADRGDPHVVPADGPLPARVRDTQDETGPDVAPVATSPTSVAVAPDGALPATGGVIGVWPVVAVTAAVAAARLRGRVDRH